MRKIIDVLKVAEQEAKAECEENYQLKFGEVISLDILDGEYFPLFLHPEIYKNL